MALAEAKHKLSQQQLAAAQEKYEQERLLRENDSETFRQEAEAMRQTLERLGIHV
jgi:hypothetical protein